jgi:hypothetical protein
MAHAARTTFLAGILAVLAAAAMQEGSRASFAATLSGPAVHASMGATPDGDHGAFGYLEFEGRSADPAGVGPSRPDLASAGEVMPSATLMAEIVAWLSANFELPAVDDFPRVEFASPRRLTALRFGAFRGRAEIASEPAEPHQPLIVRSDLLAVYDTSKRIIYLPEGWNGKSHAETSILVHEMVHHLQNVGGLKYPCTAAQEKPAYLAQDLWLRRFGHDLETTFETNLFTALVRSLCFY